MISLIPLLLLLIYGLAGIYEYKTSKAMTEEFEISAEPQSEEQKNRERIGLLRVAERYPKESKSRKMLLEHIANTYK